MKEVVEEKLDNGMYSRDFEGLKLLLVHAANEAVANKDNYVKDMQ